HHSSGDVIDLVVEDEGVSQPSSFRPRPSKETIGTTSNHPFWSVDRQEYVQAGQLEPGERVLTFSGNTKRIASKLARPGPQPVYNLEVHAEHVYFVGEDGLLTHNSQGYSLGVRRNARSGKIEQRLAANGRQGSRKGTRWNTASPIKKHPKTSQNHHLVTNQMAEALDDVGLSGATLRARRGLQYMSAPGGHTGYERWHINYDVDMLRFIRNTPDLDETTLLREIHRYYQSGDVARRIPNVDLGF
ncbi:MAG: hypothetical protein ACI92S_004625, partial [Planctomycetaceae bacterium]